MHTRNAEYFNQRNEVIIFLETRTILEEYLTNETYKRIKVHHLMLYKIENKVVKFVSSQINNILIAYILVF